MYPSALCGVQGDSSPPDEGWGKAPELPWIQARADGERNRARAAHCVSLTWLLMALRRLVSRVRAANRI